MTGSPKCPRCGAAVTGAADDLGFLVCAGCGARLRKAPTVKVTIQSPSPTSGSSPVPAAAAPPPSPTGNRDTDATDTLLARLERVDASATLPPGSQSNQALKAAGYAPVGPSAASPPPAPAKVAGTPDAVMNLIQALQRDLAALQKSHKDLAATVARLEAQKSAAAPAPGVVSTATIPAGSAATKPRPAAGSALRPILIVDDDAVLAEETRKACEKLGFSPLVVSAVRAALDAMGKERPVLLILEPMLAGELSGKDLVNYVKSTMEWIEIPILVYTRAAIVNHEQARTDFGADDYVIKAAGAADLLAKKVTRLTA
jgi:CheY-like chemotaxis protein